MAEAEVEGGSTEAEMQNLARKYKVPVGLKCLLEELSREVGPLLFTLHSSVAVSTRCSPLEEM